MKADHIMKMPGLCEFCDFNSSSRIIHVKVNMNDEESRI